MEYDLFKKKNWKMKLPNNKIMKTIVAKGRSLPATAIFRLSGSRN